MSHAEDATGIEAYYRVVTGWAVAVVGSDIKKLVQEGNLVLLRRSGPKNAVYGAGVQSSCRV